MIVAEFLKGGRFVWVDSLNSSSFKAIGFSLSYAWHHLGKITIKEWQRAHTSILIEDQLYGIDLQQGAWLRYSVVP